jgi:hypothetical protein
VISGFRAEREASDRILLEQLANVVPVACGLPLDGGEFEKTMFGPRGQQAETVSQVCPRLDVAQSAAREERREGRVHRASVVVTDKEPVLPTMRSPA